jgi:hypothetical protein
MTSDTIEAADPVIGTISGPFLGLQSTEATYPTPSSAQDCRTSLGASGGLLGWWRRRQKIA